MMRERSRAMLSIRYKGFRRRWAATTIKAALSLCTTEGWVQAGYWPTRFDIIFSGEPLRIREAVTVLRQHDFEIRGLHYE
jgi:hypothetical protein